MAKRVKSIEELRQELADRQAELAHFESRREQLAKQLAALDKGIAVLTGESAPALGRKRGKKKARRKAKATIQTKGKRGRPTKKQVKRTKRATNTKSLAEYIADALAGKERGVSAKEITAAVQKAGYKTKSKAFGVVVRVLLSKDKRFKNVGPGMFTLA